MRRVFFGISLGFWFFLFVFFWTFRGQHGFFFSPPLHGFGFWEREFSFDSLLNIFPESL